MNKTILALLLSVVGVAAQPIVPATTVWSRAFLRQTNWSSPSSGVLSLPTVGQSVTKRFGSLTPVVGSLPGVYLGAGNCGVIRDIWFVGGFGELGVSSNLYFEVFCDAGNIANLTNPPLEYLSFKAPVSVLLGNNYRPVTDTEASYYQSDRSSMWINSHDMFVDSTQSGQVVSWDFLFKLPIPFSNGVYITLWQQSSNRPSIIGFSLVNYESASSATALNSLQGGDWRLHGQLVQEHNGSQFTKYIRTLDRASGPGHLVGVWASFKSPSDEGNAQTWYDSVPWTFGNYSVAGTEDLFQNTFGWNKGVWQGWDHGTSYVVRAPSSNAVWNVESYRFWDVNGPSWTNGIAARWSPVVTNLDADILTAYYAPSDGAYVWDSDVTNFLARAGGTNWSDYPTALAVDALVKTMKASNWWTLQDLVYPMVGFGGSTNWTNSVSQNLKSSSFKIAFSGSVLCDTNGATSSNNTGFGDTGYVPTVNAVSYALNSAHLFMVNRTATLTNGVGAGGALAGRYGANNNKCYIEVASATAIAFLGPNDNSAGFANTTTVDQSGDLIMNRTGAGALSAELKQGANIYAATATTASVGLPNSSIILFARDVGLDHPGNCNLAGMTLGGAIPLADVDNYLAMWDTFNLKLRRSLNILP